MRKETSAMQDQTVPLSQPGRNLETIFDSCPTHIVLLV